MVRWFGLASLIASFQYFDFDLPVFPVTLKARVVTEELLRALLGFGTLGFRDQKHGAWIKWISALVWLANAFTAKTTLILKFVWTNLGHTI